MAFVASQPWHYLLGFGAIVGSGIGFGTIIPLSTAVTRWFKRYRGRANGLAMTASGLAGFIVAPMINRILAANGGNWRQAWMIVSGMAIVGGIIAYLFVKERPEDLGQTADGEVEEAACAFPAQTYSTQYDWTPTEAYKTPAYWLILIASIACQFPFFFVTAHWVLHLKGMGISAADAALAIGIYTGSSVGGRLLAGWLMDTLAAPSVFVLGTCCTILGACLAIVANTSMIAYSAALLMGAGFGWTFVALNTVVGNYYGPEAFPKLMGMLLLLTALVSCSPAGLIGGMLFDRYKSYTPAFSLIIAVCGASIVALYFAKMPQPKKAYLPAD